MGEEPAAAVDVLLADASALRRRRLRAALEATRRVRVGSEARSGTELVERVHAAAPAVVLLTLPLPGALEAVETLMARTPVPILVLTEDASAAVPTLAAGALEAVPAAAPERADLVGYAAGLADQVAIAARIRVITHPRARLRRAPAPAPRSPADATEPVRVVAIGASTGGPQALAQVLGALPAGFPATVVVVQHMAEGFLDGMVRWLGSLCALPVVLATTGGRLQPGTVSVAPGGLNLSVGRGLRVACTPPDRPQFHVPAIDVAFGSLAAAAGPASIGVLLTGMGRDGARGLRELRERGAITIAQDEASSAVYGMPGAAVALDAVDRQLPLAEIGPAVVRAVEERSTTVVTR